QTAAAVRPGEQKGTRHARPPRRQGPEPARGRLSLASGPRWAAQLVSKREARRRAVERAHVERDELLRLRAEHVALLVLLGLRPVLERAPVLRRVLLRDLRREGAIGTAKHVDRRLPVRRLVANVHPEREARIAREIA